MKRSYNQINPNEYLTAGKVDKVLRDLPQPLPKETQRFVVWTDAEGDHRVTVDEAIKLEKEREKYMYSLWDRQGTRPITITIKSDAHYLECFKSRLNAWEELR